MCYERSAMSALNSTGMTNKSDPLQNAGSALGEVIKICLHSRLSLQ